MVEVPTSVEVIRDTTVQTWNDSSLCWSHTRSSNTWDNQTCCLLAINALISLFSFQFYPADLDIICLILRIFFIFLFYIFSSCFGFSIKMCCFHLWIWWLMVRKLFFLVWFSHFRVSLNRILHVFFNIDTQDRFKLFLTAWEIIFRLEKTDKTSQHLPSIVSSPLFVYC